MVCLLLCAAAGTFAQHWSVNPRAWQYDMTAYLQLKVGGKAVADYADYELAAFCGEECRGVAKVLTVEGGPSLLYLRIYSNATNGERVTFRVYKASSDKEWLLDAGIEFEAQTVGATPSEPLQLTLNDIMFGDVNGDLTIDALDASLILQYVAHKFGDENTGFNREAADVNADGTVDALDASLVLQHAAKKINLNEIKATE